MELCKINLALPGWVTEVRDCDRQVSLRTKMFSQNCPFSSHIKDLGASQMPAPLAENKLSEEKVALNVTSLEFVGADLGVVC